MPASPGRPRVMPGSSTGGQARQQILDAAASLFSERGYAATSTRQIAQRTGIRQASLYYYFAGKDEIFLSLLEASILPTLERAADFLDMPDPRAALHDLIVADVRTLMTEPYNIGTLYLSPELTTDAFTPFRQARAELIAIYGELACRISPSADPGFIGACCIQLVEMVITLRQLGDVPEDVAERISAACLNLVDA